MLASVPTTTPRLAYRVAEAADLLALSEDTIRRMIDRNELRPVRTGRSVRIPAAELQRWLESSTTSSAAAQ